MRPDDFCCRNHPRHACNLVELRIMASKRCAALPPTETHFPRQKTAECLPENPELQTADRVNILDSTALPLTLGDMEKSSDEQPKKQEQEQRARQPAAVVHNP